MAVMVMEQMGHATGLGSFLAFLESVEMVLPACRRCSILKVSMLASPSNLDRSTADSESLQSLRKSISQTSTLTAICP